tara:strand:+ start:72 stop:293 length:222 start_codon:yes stop_codon:yes gene_type:complete
MSEEVKTIAIDGVDYALEDLSDMAKYCISQMQEVTKEMDSTKRLVDRLQMSFNGFSDNLKKELADTPVEVPSE